MGTGRLEVAASAETHMERWLEVYFLLDTLDEEGAVIKDLDRQMYSRDCY